MAPATPFDLFVFLHTSRIMPVKTLLYQALLDLAHFGELCAQCRVSIDAAASARRSLLSQATFIRTRHVRVTSDY